MTPPRPVKRTRVDAETPEASAPLDRIFITDGFHAKKPSKKTPLSCCECRRLKLKCDRTFPCTSCKKRGCEEICPDGEPSALKSLVHRTHKNQGVLISGKGTRFILANTEQLHSKIQQMSDRIRGLEDALQAIHSEHEDQPHPLMRPELLVIKSTMGFYTAQSPSEGHPATQVSSQIAGPSNQQSHHHTSSEDTLMFPNPVQEDSSEAHFQAEIARLSHSFPLTETISTAPNIPLRRYIASHLPPREEADYLWIQARQNALWQYNPHPSSTFYPNLAYHCYDTMSAICPRRLALLYMILAVGCLVDLQNRGADHPDAEKYHHLARACLCELPVMEETSVDAITALFYEIWYLLVFSDKKKAAGYAWGLMGLTAKLAQSIGLHRNGGKSKVIPEEVEKRRSLFWELLYLDARLSLSLGRPPSLSISHVDCPRPSYTPDEGSDLSESLHDYQEWKHSCYLHCLAPVLDAISQPSLDYATVIQLDKQIREFPIPSFLREKNVRSRTTVMQKASLSTALEAVLLQLHRQFFTRALSGPDEALNRRHQYAPSLVAVVLSASRMIATVQDLYNREPHLTARILGYWSNAFSAAVALCLLASRAPFTCLAPVALQELERARILFRSAKDFCPRAMQVIPILETMIDKANAIYDRWSISYDMTTCESTMGYDIANCESMNGGSSTGGVHVDQCGTTGGGQYISQQQPAEHDPFDRFHPILVQCVSEIHQRANALLSRTASQPRKWGPTPIIQSPCSPVLPPEVPQFALGGTSTYSQNGLNMPSSSSSSSQAYLGSSPIDVPYGRPSDQKMFYSSSNTVLSNNDNDNDNAATIPKWPASTLKALSPTSKMAIVDTINFELGALNTNSDQSWMSFF